MMEILNTLMPNFERLSEEFYECLFETIIMVQAASCVTDWYSIHLIAV